MRKITAASVLWLVVFLWMACIFWLSHQPAVVSNQMSTGLAAAVIRFAAFLLRTDTGDGTTLLWLNLLLRKVAHALAYGILAVLTASALHRSGSRRVYPLAFLICVLYAVSDEIHQLYVPGRGGQALDVLIDSGGALIGLFVHMLYSRKSKPNPLHAGMKHAHEKAAHEKGNQPH